MNYVSDKKVKKKKTNNNKTKQNNNNDSMRKVSAVNFFLVQAIYIYI